MTQRQDATGVIDTLEISTKDKVQLSTLSDHTSESLIIGVTEHVSGHWAHVITFLVALDDVGTFTCNTVYSERTLWAHVSSAFW